MPELVTHVHVHVFYSRHRLCHYVLYQGLTKLYREHEETFVRNVWQHHSVRVTYSKITQTDTIFNFYHPRTASVSADCIISYVAIWTHRQGDSHKRSRLLPNPCPSYLRSRLSWRTSSRTISGSLSTLSNIITLRSWAGGGRVNVRPSVQSMLSRMLRFHEMNLDSNPQID